jgi:hypothetical protein
MCGLWDDPRYQQFEALVLDRLIPMLRETAATVSLVPRGALDVKFAIELGLSIVMDKPIIALVLPGMSIPHGLASVAAEIVEVDIARDPDGAERSITEAFARIMGARHVALEDLDDD